MCSERRRSAGARGRRRAPPSRALSGAASALDARALLERISDAFVALDRDWRYVYVNAKAGELFGRRPEDLLGKHIWTEFPEGKGQPFHLAYERAMAEQRPIVLEGFYEPWQRWFENRIFPSPDGVAIFFTEITERRRAEAELRESESRFARLVDNFQGLAYRCRNEPGWPAEFVNRGVFELTGFRPEKFFGEDAVSFGDLIHPDDRERAWEGVQLALAERRPYEVTYRLVCREGRTRWCWGRGVGVYDELGEVRFLEGFASDVTARVEAEERIRAQVNELDRWYRATLGREERVAELKREADDLRARLGEPRRYASAARADDASGDDAGEPPLEREETGP